MIWVISVLLLIFSLIVVFSVIFEVFSSLLSVLVCGSVCGKLLKMKFLLFCVSFLWIRLMMILFVISFL